MTTAKQQLTHAADPAEDQAGAPSEAEAVFASRAGLDAFRSTVAELHVQRALEAVDPSATHIGGNRAVRDHELFDNTAWVNTKTAFPTRDPATFGHSHVNWTTARNPAQPDRQLDLVALVEIYPDDLTFRDTDGPGLEIRWTEPRWWLIPASVLHTAGRRDGKSTVRDLVPVAIIRPYQVTRPLTRRRLKKLIAENQIA